MASPSPVGTNASEGLAGLFRATGGSGRDPLNAQTPGLDDMETNSEFMKNFNTPYTGANGAGPILNANANLVPTRTDQYRDTSSFSDYRLDNGLGRARPFRKSDSIGGQTADGFQGNPFPSKMFGRDSTSYDLNYRRTDMQERANMTLKKMGYKPNEAPQYADYFPWQWYDLQALGIGGTPIGNSNQYNRNHSMPDADAIAARQHTPAPSRLTKMLVTDMEMASLAPNRTMLHPLKVVTEDHSREQMQRISKNTDVIEAVTYQNITPRGMGRYTEAPRVYAHTDVLRQPIGTNDTGGRAVNGRWNNQYAAEVGDPLIASTLEDRLQLYKDDLRIVQGKDPELEEKEFLSNASHLDKQGFSAQDTFNIQPQPGEYPHDASGINAPLRMPHQVGNGSGLAS